MQDQPRHQAVPGLAGVDAVARGEVVLDDPLETHLPELAGTPAGGVTLVSLATHTSGLPRLPEGAGGLRSALSPRDPYPAWSVGQLTDAARAGALRQRPAGSAAYDDVRTRSLAARP